MMALRQFSLQLIVMFVSLASSGAAIADFMLVSNYEFNGTLSDSLGNNSDFTAIGSPSFNGGMLGFDEPDGLALSTPLTAGDYRIELDFTFSVLGRYSKLIDFQERSLDEGFYVSPGNVLTFYSGFGSGSDLLSIDSQYTIALEKIDSTVTAYLNGVQQFTFLDPTPATSPSNTLVFFADDAAVSGEGAIGSVDSIRLYITAVPEPASYVLLAVVGSGALLIVRLRKNWQAPDIGAKR